MSRLHRNILALSTLFISLAYAEIRIPGTWVTWRGPHQTGVSDETGLPSSWSPEGENLVWKAPFGGRSAPIIMEDRLYMVNVADEGEQEQERVLCLDANTGKKIWEYRFNVYGSDVPPHRALNRQCP